MEEDPFDVEKLRLTPELVAETNAKRAQLRAAKRQQKAEPEGSLFVQMPYRPTLRLAGRLQNAPWAVMVELTYLVWKTRRNPVVLTNAALRSVGVSHDAKARALRRLEEAGAVTVDWRGKGQSPLVTVLNLRSSA